MFDAIKNLKCALNSEYRRQLIQNLIKNESFAQNQNQIYRSD